ncbi:MAG: hypothetical protein ACOC1K_03880 [Nanoarchaeota archaeon]
MNQYKKMLITSALFISASLPNYSINDEPIKKANDKQNYIIVVDKEGMNLQEGANISTINNEDTTRTQTNYIGLADIKARPQDKLLIQPSNKTDNFQDLETILGDKTFQIHYVQPKDTTKIYK